MSSADRTGRKVLVTGCGSGIGAAIAARLADDGWTVIGADRAAPGPDRPGGDWIVADLANPAELCAVIDRAPGVDAIVHAAGFMRTGDLSELDPVDGAAMWAIHVDALVRLAQAYGPKMTAGGHLLAIGSRTSGGAAGKSQYAACKAAVTALIKSWAIELAPRGATANVIAPAATATPLLSAPDRAGVAPSLPPIGRFIEPSEIAAYAAFILSPQADAITGQELLICGGASL